jgi:hypothetical protein
VIVALGRMLAELRTGDVEVMAEQRAILDELTAEAEKHGLGY